MKSMLQRAFLWCVLTTLLPSITNAKPLNPDGLRRLNVWLQGKVWNDVRSVSESSEGDTEGDVLSHQSNSSTESFEPQHRMKRVVPANPQVKRIERAGCILSTCSVHDLAHLVHQMGTKTNAPPEKIDPKGYGRRRRRRSLPMNHPVLTFDGGHLKLAWVRRHPFKM